MRVLVAFPDNEFRATLQNYLRHAGIETDFASDGLSCIARLREQRPDAIALGSTLLWGGSDGVIELMRSTAEWRAVPVILLFSSPRDAALEVHPPVAATATAPFRISDLARQIFFTATLAKMKVTQAGPT